MTIRYGKFFKLAFLSVVLFLAGKELQSLYGHNPPVVFYFSGVVLEVTSYLLIFITAVIMIFDIYKVITSGNKT